MTDYSELVKALRICHVVDCDDCVLKKECVESIIKGERPYVLLHNDAAAAIEALDRLLDQNTQRCEALRKQLREAHESYERHLNDLEAEVKRLKLSCADCEYGNSPWPEEPVHEPKREEVWKDVIGYEGLYQVSDQARVRNNKGKILKQSVKVGKCVYYKYVKLYKDGQYRQGYVHRMMAECFIPNPDNLPIINHKDEDGTNNRLDNLEWCTVEYNSNYGNAKRNMSRGKRRRAKMEVQE